MRGLKFEVGGLLVGLIIKNDFKRILYDLTTLPALVQLQ